MNQNRRIRRMDQLPTRARILVVRAITTDCRTIGIRIEITDGPKSLIGRTLDLIIGPERLLQVAMLQSLLAQRQESLDNRSNESVTSEV